MFVITMKMLKMMALSVLPVRPDQVAKQLVGGEGGEGVVHHAGHQVLQLVPGGGQASSDWSIRRPTSSF